MLNRLLIGAAGLIAGSLVATPAVLGLSGNSSFSRDIQVPVPSGAHQVRFVEPEPSEATSATPQPRSSELTDDRPGHDVVSSDATDDHGGLRSSSSSDDRSGRDGPGGEDNVGATDDVSGADGTSGTDDRRGSNSGSDDSGSDDHSGGRGDG
jgi:hypothetical protein